MTLVDIRPSSDFYVDAGNDTPGETGPIFRRQNENQTGNVAFYEIQHVDDFIKIDVEQFDSSLEDAALIWNSIWGPTEFDLVDRTLNKTLISEVSGFDSDVWIFDISDGSGQYTLTNFDNTQAGWYAYVEVRELQGVV